MQLKSLAGRHDSLQSLDTSHGKFNTFEHSQMEWSWSVRKKRFRRIKIVSLHMEMAI